MSEERFRPNRINNGNSLPQKVPTQRIQPQQNRMRQETPMQGTQRVGMNTAQNRDFEVEKRTERPQRQSFEQNINPRQSKQFSHQEDDFYPSHNQEKIKKGFPKSIKIVLISVIVILIFLIGFRFLTNGNNPFKGIDASSILNGQEDNLNSNKVGSTGSLFNSDTSNVSYGGDLIPVKWPADITPTKMEIQLDPTTGDPILILIGDKSGLGTVIRSYNKSGVLTGFWVIVPDNSLSTETNNTNNTKNTTEEKTEDSNNKIETDNSNNIELPSIGSNGN